MPPHPERVVVTFLYRRGQLVRVHRDNFVYRIRRQRYVTRETMASYNEYLLEDTWGEKWVAEADLVPVEKRTP